VIFFSYNMLNRYILAEKIKEKPIWYVELVKSEHYN
jgi:hypothetical protein